jgi:hypothetical protein
MISRAKLDKKFYLIISHILYKNIIIVDLFIVIFFFQVIFYWFLIVKMVRIIENYTLYEIIGEGAYGKVYRSTNKLDSK